MKSTVKELMNDLKEINLSVFGGISVSNAGGHTRLYFTGGGTTVEVIANKPLDQIIAGADAAMQIKISS